MRRKERGGRREEEGERRKERGGREEEGGERRKERGGRRGEEGRRREKKQGKKRGRREEGRGGGRMCGWRERNKQLLVDVL